MVASPFLNPDLECFNWHRVPHLVVHPGCHISPNIPPKPPEMSPLFSVCQPLVSLILSHHQLPTNQPPHPGVLSGYFTAAELLLQAKAEVDTRNERNMTAFDLAVQPGSSTTCSRSEIPNNHLTCRVNPANKRDIYYINRCRISSIESKIGLFLPLQGLVPLARESISSLRAILTL